MKKLFLGIALILILTSSFAIEITDLSTQIDVQNNQINANLNANYAKIQAGLSQVSQSNEDLKNQILEIKSQLVLKEDLPGIFADMRAITHQGNQQNLLSQGILLLLAFMALFILKSQNKI